MSSQTCRGCGRRLERSRRRYCDHDCERRGRLRAASERAQTAREHLDATPLSDELTARHSTPCNYCQRRIVKNRSQIVAVAASEPIVVHLDADGWPAYPRVRSFVHAACAIREGRQP